jgi:CTP:molybdopterin cytidylyltransferase MocA
MSDAAPIAAIVLAGGRSERMKYPKPLLIFGKQTAIDRVIGNCKAGGCDAVIVVLGHDADRVRANASLQGAVVVENEAHALGQTSSLQAGLRALPAGCGAVLLLPVDCTMVDPSTIEALIAAHRERGAKIVLPVHDHRRGHPALFDATLVAEFLALDPGAPAHTVVRGDPSRVLEIETEDGEVVRDLDTGADYYRALEVYSERGGEAGFLAPKGAGGRPAPKRPPV